MTDGALLKVLGAASNGAADLEGADRTSQRILDAALHEAATVGLQRLTVEDVVRRAKVARMTVYRRYPRRDDLVEALVRRETQRFLAAVADGIDSSADPHDGVVEAFIAAVRFARTHPMLRRAAHAESALSAADNAELLDIGAAFIARHIHGDAPGTPKPEVGHREQGQKKNPGQGDADIEGHSQLRLRRSRHKTKGPASMAGKASGGSSRSSSIIATMAPEA